MKDYHLYNIIQILTLGNFFFVKLSLIFILIGLIKILLLLLRCTRSAEEYATLFKRRNKYVNWFWIILYILIFIVGLFSLRIYRMGFKLDLKPLIDSYKFLYYNSDYLMIVLQCLFLILVLLMFINVLKRVKEFFEIRLIRQHLISIQDNTDIFNPYIEIFISKKLFPLPNKFYHKIIKIFYYFSLNKIKIILGTFHESLKRKYIQDKPSTLLILILDNILTFYYKNIFFILEIKYNVWILLLIIIYDIVYNHFIIYHIFYILPFYFIYILWYKSSQYLISNNVDVLDRIIYEMFYLEPNIKYLFLNQEQKEILTLYIIGFLSTNKQGIMINAGHVGDFILLKNKYFLYSYREGYHVTENEDLYFNKYHGHMVKIHKDNPTVPIELEND